jgi:O-antigen ligase
MKKESALSFIETSTTWLVICFPLFIAAGKAISEFGLIAIVVLFISHLLITLDFKFLKEKWLIVAGIFWLYLVARSLFVPDIKHALVKSLPFIRFILFAACFQSLVQKDKKTNQRIFIVLCIAIGFLTLDGFIQFFNEQDIFGRVIRNGYRLTGPFSKPILGTATSSLGIIAIAGLVPLLMASRNYLPLIFLAASLIFTITFLSGERSALLRLISSIGMLWLGLFLLVKDKKPRKDFWIIAVLIPIVCIICAKISISLKPEMLERQVLSPATQAQAGLNSPYLFLWWIGIKAGLSNILFGIGPNQYEFYCQANPHHTMQWCGNNLMFFHPHNIWVEIFAESGLIGIVLFSILLYILAKKLIGFCKAQNNFFESSLAIGIALSGLQRFFPLPSSGFFKNWYAIPIWFAIGWVLYIISSRKSTT